MLRLTVDGARCEDVQAIATKKVSQAEIARRLSIGRTSVQRILSSPRRKKGIHHNAE